MFRSPPASALLEQFRANRSDPSCNLHDLETWLRGKLAIARRRCKRSLGATSTAQQLEAMAAEVKSTRFDVIARRAALPRMSVLG